MKTRNINFHLPPLVLPIVVLIGPPGSGKTVVGQSLATDLNWQFLDTDIVIESAAGQKITEIFSTQGEDIFRFFEKTLIKNILNQFEDTNPSDPHAPSYAGTIISCGGGLPVPLDNFANLKKLGNIVYLDAPTNVLMARISHMTHRPLLDSMPRQESTSEPSDYSQRLSRLDILIKQRKEVYNQADYKIDTTNKNIKEVASAIRSILAI